MTKTRIEGMTVSSTDGIGETGYPYIKIETGEISVSFTTCTKIQIYLIKRHECKTLNSEIVKEKTHRDTGFSGSSASNSHVQNLKALVYQKKQRTE